MNTKYFYIFTIYKVPISTYEPHEKEINKKHFKEYWRIIRKKEVFYSMSQNKYCKYLTYWKFREPERIQKAAEKKQKKAENEIKKQNENHTSKEITIANIITLLVFILIIWWVIS